MFELLAEDVYVTMISVKPVAKIYVYCMRHHRISVMPK
ncbi:Uncharacterised protein [Klebsiella quasipneumoniae]|nr:Uncharacterised protein [Klebsiella quasipneumoniae]